MPNKYVTDIIGLISRPLDDLESGRIDAVEICIKISRKEITGHIATECRRKDEEDEH